ncbi:MAG: glycosyl hydrolase family 18 protein [Terriglobales bacterium]
MVFAPCIAASPSFAQQSSVAARPIVVGYFRGDSMRRQFFLKDLVADGAASILDQINYSQGNIANNRCIVADPVADLTYSFSAGDSVDGTADAPDIPLKGNFHQLQKLKRLYPRLKVMISLEGNADVFVKAAQPENRISFVTSCVQQFIQGKIADGIEAPGIFDGIDVDWEYPLEADKYNFVALLAEFRRQLDAIGPNHLLSVAMGTGRNTYQHLDMATVARYVDQVGIMNYDYAGPWNKKTGLVAPLYHAPGDPEFDGSVDATIWAYKSAGVPLPRMLMGLPFYAYSWTQVAPTNHGLFQLGEPDQKDALYNYIGSIQSKFTMYRDPSSLAPWLFDGNTFWTYDDELSIGTKVKYAKDRGLQGVMIWELSGDTADGKLLKTIGAALDRHDQGGKAGHGTP